MKEVTIIYRHNKNFEVELIASSDFTVEKFIKEIAGVYKLDMGRNPRLQAEPLGTLLINDSTFEAQGIVDRCVLTLVDI